MKNNKESICNPLHFKNIYMQYSKDLYLYIYYKYGDKETSEDVVQETFIKLWHKCNTICYEKVKSYIYVIAKNLMIDVFRNKSKEQKSEITYELEEDQNLFEESNLEDVNDYQKKIDVILKNMPENYKIVFLLNRLENKKYSEISEMLNISVKAVEKRMHNAFIYLREAKKSISNKNLS